MSLQQTQLRVIVVGDADPASGVLRHQSLSADHWQVVGVSQNPTDEGFGNALAEALRSATKMSATHVTVIHTDRPLPATYLEKLVEATSEDRLTIAVDVGDVAHPSVGPLTEYATYLMDLEGLVFPADWLADAQDPGVDGPTAETVLVAQALMPYHRQIANADLIPLPTGRPLTPTRGLSLEQCADALTGIVGDTAPAPQERGPLTLALLDAFIKRLPADLASDEHQDRLSRLLKQRGVQDVEVVRRSQTWPTLGSLIDDDVPAPPLFTVLCADARQLTMERGLLSLLRLGGSSFKAGAFRGDPDPKLRVDFRRLAGGSSGSSRVSRTARARAFAARAERGVRRRALRVVLTPRLLPPTVFRDPTIRDTNLARWASETEVIALDDFGRKSALAVGLSSAPIELLDSWAVLTVAARPSVTLGQTRTLRRSLRRLQLSDNRDILPPPEIFLLAAYKVGLSGRVEGARATLNACCNLYPGTAATPEKRLLDLFVDVVEQRDVPHDAEARISAELERAERLYPHDEARRLLTLEVALHTLFHPDAQTVVPKPSLFDPNRELVTALGSSSLWQAMAPTRLSAATMLDTPVDGRASTLVLRGSYPKFSGVVHEALSAQQPCDAVDVGLQDSRLRGVGPALWGASVARDLAQGIRTTVPPALVETLAGRDTIFVDWADKEAVFATALAPENARIIIRFHGADGLSMWQFLIDWSKVSDVIFVSEHLRRAVTQVLGDRLQHTRTHVIANIIDFEKFERTKPDSAVRHLGMVGWAQRVKDPIWALDVLALLRQADPTWTLTLIGADFPPTNPRLSERDYSIDFRERALRDDVVEGIRFVDYTHDLPRYLTDVGFGLSTSLRESNPVGVMEMVAAGALPVIREWPVFEHVGGPHTMLPTEWIVRTPEDAAARIQAHADVDVWRSAAADALAELRERFGSDEVASRYREVVFGGGPERQGR